MQPPERRCPTCGGAITAIGTRGPSTHCIAPCGCEVTANQLRSVIGHTKPTVDVNRGRGIRTDGGVFDEPDVPVVERDIYATCHDCEAHWSAHDFPLDSEVGRQFVAKSATFHAVHMGHEVDLDFEFDPEYDHRLADPRNPQRPQSHD